MIETLQQFHFVRPLWWLALPLVMALVYHWQKRHGDNSEWSHHIDPTLLSHLLETTQSTRSRLLPPLLYCGAVLCVFCLAGPSWEKTKQPPRQLSDTLVIISDMTLSMHSEDISPSRLIRQRYKLLELLKQRDEGQTGLIAYSADAHALSPLTDDANTIAALVPALSPGTMPAIGSNAPAAFALAAELISNADIRRARIAWFTDEILEGHASLIDKALRGIDAELIVVGIGTQTGSPVRLPSGRFVTDEQGDIVSAKLNRSALDRFATQRGGRYFDIQNDNTDIEFILNTNLYNGASIQNTGQERELEVSLDRGAWFAVALLPMVLMMFRRGIFLPIVLLALLRPTAPVTAAENRWWDNLWETPDQQGQRLMDAGDPAAAATRFIDLNRRGVAEFTSGQYAAAAANFAPTAAENTEQTQSLPPEQRSLAPQESHYNRGHSLALDGKLQNAIDAYDAALTLDPGFEDAQLARDIIEKLLEEQEQQDQQDQQNQQPQEQSDQDEQSDSEEQQANNSEQPQDSSQEQQSNGSEQQSNPGDENEFSDNDQAVDPQENEEEQGDKQLEEEQPQQLEEAAGQEEESEEGEQATATVAAEQQELSNEQRQQLQQWLNQIPDDPSGLLRRKFQYERSLKERKGEVVVSEKDGQIW